MKNKIDCQKDLQIKDCDWTVEGEAPADVVEMAVKHLRNNHNLDVPDAENILEGDYDPDDLDEGARVVVQRLRETLNVQPAKDALESQPAFDAPTP